MGDLFEQRQVVDRIRVKNSLNGVPVQLASGQPGMNAGDFTLAKRGRTGDLTRELALRITDQLDSDQFFNTKGSGDRAGDKFVGGGDDHHLITGRLMGLHQRQRLWQDHGVDDGLHKAGVCLSRFFSALGTHGTGGKAHIVINIQRTSLVVLVILSVAPLEIFTIAPAQRQGEFAPLVVRVHRDQCVVQIE